MRDNEPVFEAPWQARAFALVIRLHEAGIFTWDEWTQVLGATIAERQKAGVDEYYNAWLMALERMVSAKGLAAGEDLHHLREAWREAAARTPHGEPIEISKSALYK